MGNYSDTVKEAMVVKLTTEDAKTLTELNNSRYLKRQEEQLRKQRIESDPYAHLLYPNYKKLI